MIQTIKNFFGIGVPTPDLGELRKQGAIILDVRTRGEYQSGHIKGSVNIPLNELQGQLSKLKKEKAIIT